MTHSHSADDGATPTHGHAAPMRRCAIPDTPLALAASGIDNCVHCGFCLQACPTYLATNDENDSPRGRVLLMRALVEGDLALDDASVQTHIDRCLGCRGCETACPSGVPYGALLEATRATMLTTRPLPFVARIILGVFERPTLLAMFLFGGRVLRATPIPALLARLHGRLGFAFAMLRSTVRPVVARAYTPRGDGGRGRTAVLEGCVMRGLFAETNRATSRVLRENDYDVVSVNGQGCCGALHAHAGDLEGARALARRNVAAFDAANVEFIAINASGCGAMVKEYGHLLADDPVWSERASRVSSQARDVSELLAAAGPKAGGEVACRVTYDAPCHLVHAQRVTAPPMALLAAIPGLQLVPLVDADQCCGSAGIYNLIEPEISDAVLELKLARIGETNAALLATGNPGCLMQIGAGLSRRGSATRVVHPVDLLDASYGARQT